MDLSELKNALELVGFKIPQWQVRQMIEEMDQKKQLSTKGQISINEFQTLCTDLKSQEVASSFKTQLTKKDNLQKLGGMSTASSVGTTHSVRQEEQVAFTNWINSYVTTFSFFNSEIQSFLIDYNCNGTQQKSRSRSGFGSSSADGQLEHRLVRQSARRHFVVQNHQPLVPRDDRRTCDQQKRAKKFELVFAN